VRRFFVVTSSRGIGNSCGRLDDSLAHLRFLVSPGYNFITPRRQRDAAQEEGDAAKVKVLESEIDEMGGRELYQRASQVSTSFCSTSKWVLAFLMRKGWLYGIPAPSSSVGSTEDDDDHGDDGFTVSETDAGRCNSSGNNKRRIRDNRRHTRLLEVGAINRELLDFAAREEFNHLLGTRVAKFRLNVRTCYSG